MSGARLDLAVLAEYASVHPADGRLSLIGGGIRELAFSVFPATQARLSLAVGIEVLEEELGRPHQLRIEAAPPSDLQSGEVAKPLDVTFTLPEDERGERPGYIHLVSHMDNLAFQSPGRYRFAVTIDGEHVRDLFLDARQEGTDVPPDALLMEGYEAFASGNLAEAERIFRAVIERFPTVPGGYNNLGFVRIAQGDGDEALESLFKASELGYGYPELNTANIATAMFVSRDFSEALELFDNCLRSGIFRSTGMLYGLSASAPFPVALPSAADYVALMALNAAWSAARAGDKSRARGYLDEVRGQQLAKGTDDRGENVRRSIGELDAVVKA